MVIDPVGSDLHHLWFCLTVGNFAVKSNCTRLAIDKPTVGPEAIATLRTSVYQHGTPNYECRRFYVSFWVRFSDRPVFTENPEDELRLRETDNHPSDARLYHTEVYHKAKHDIKNPNDNDCDKAVHNITANTELRTYYS
ncbi:hypothetical protein RvY_16298 [Ramazzottius varieornatus]|uniref:Uncharacterized protein n=1 Tax=Ramazzottius varieornatus TaxID=947166 RepID=A0A1D1VYX0_RAMVA|nr:hypothetical protein RvY_16298 [Ramazzottius varieornatus]